MTQVATQFASDEAGSANTLVEGVRIEVIHVGLSDILLTDSVTKRLFQLIGIGSGFIVFGLRFAIENDEKAMGFFVVELETKASSILLPSDPETPLPFLPLSAEQEESIVLMAKQCLESIQGSSMAQPGTGG